MIHLHTHSEYSLLEASPRVKELAKKAAQDSMPALALTDIGNMFGAIEFYFACKDAKVKPIIGIEVFLAPGSRLEKKQTGEREAMHRGPGRLVLLAQNLQGYQNLCALSTLGFQEGFYYKPRVDLELLARYSDSLVCLSGGVRSDLLLTLQKEGKDAALDKLLQYKKIFGDRFYLEVFRTGFPIEFENLYQEWGREHQVSLVAANEVYYPEREDQIAQEVLVCIGSNRTLSDDTRNQLGSSQYYFKKQAEMQEFFADHPEWLAATEEISDRLDVQFRLKDPNGKTIYHLPSFPTEGGRTLKEEIRERALAGLKERFHQSELRNEKVTDETREEYLKRLDFELSVIDRMGFNGYFLIVADFITWAKSKDIPVGPGRGSGAGSLVAYCLLITDLDPVPYKLLFERFLNPERISMPDFDIDFCQDRRGEVIDYVTQKYGAASVSQIITYGKLQCRAALKDVGRVLGMTFAEVDVVSKLVPDKLNITIAEALKEEPKLVELMESNPQVGTLIELAQKVEGLVRHAGIHAAGVIIADGELVRHAPLYRGADGENVVQYDMKHAEKIGLIKFDFLGLKTLTLIQRAIKLIERNRGKKIELHQISLNDPGIYSIMSKGNTAGIFQFEGDGITDAIRKIKPSSFFDITAINALYRPGPMAMIPEFAKRKNGEAPVEYLFPELKEVLEETYGIIVYQEQVMGIASKIAGYSLGEADMLRRAMGKKIKEEMDQHRERFLRGAKQNGFDEKKSNELFDLMYKFADYGFNKSHAAAYCVVAAHTAWLKNYYPAEFYAALLSTELANTDNVVRYVKDAQKHGIEVKPPNVNASEFLFNVIGETIYFGLGAIKGVGEGAVLSIVESRQMAEPAQFSSVDDFFNRVDAKKLNKKLIEAFIKAGALDGFGLSRAELMHNFPQYLERAQQNRKNKEVGQRSLFELESAEEQLVVTEKVKPWPRAYELAAEKEVLGFYLTDHPLRGYDTISTVWVSSTVNGLQNLLNTPETNPVAMGKYPKHQRKRRVVLFGLIGACREVITKKGTRMAFASLEDLTGQVELIVFPDTYAQVSELLKSDQPVLVGGLLEGGEEQNSGVKIIVDSLIPVEDAIRKSKKIRIHLDRIEEQQAGGVLDVLKRHPGTTQLDFLLSLEDLGQKVQIHPKGLQGVELKLQLLEDLRSQVGHIRFVEVL